MQHEWKVHRPLEEGDKWAAGLISLAKVAQCCWLCGGAASSGDPPEIVPPSTLHQSQIV